MILFVGKNLICLSGKYKINCMNKKTKKVLAKCMGIGYTKRAVT